MPIASRSLVLSSSSSSTRAARSATRRLRDSARSAGFDRRRRNGSCRPDRHRARRSPRRRTRSSDASRSRGSGVTPGPDTRSAEPADAARAVRPCLRRSVLLLDTKRQGLESAVNQVGRVRIETGTKDATEIANQGDEAGLPRHYAPKYIVVAAQILRGAVHDDVDAMARRLEVDWRRKRAVDERS